MINEQVTALYQNRQESCVLPAHDSKRRKREEEAGYIGPQTMSPDAFQLQMWDLLTHGGFVSHTHHDAAGGGTWMAIRTGAKFWTLLDISQDGTKSRQALADRFYHSTGLFIGQSDKDIPHQAVTVCLQRGDIL